MNEPAGHSDAWLQRRQRMHQVLEEEVGFDGNPSSLEILGHAHQRWTDEQLAHAWAEAGRRPGRGTELNHVYVHVPFCKSICHFCNYKRLRPAHAGLLDLWLERVEASLITLGPSLQAFEFHSLYIGGGTPSLLPAAHIDKLFTLLHAHVPFVHNAGRYFEADPAVLGDDKLAVLRSHGVFHVSMGVQTLDARVNAAHDRGRQDAPLIEQRVQAIRQAGIRSTSLDFLLGLHGTDPESIFADIDRALGECAPQWVDLFFITPTDRYVDLHFDGSHDAFWAHQARFADAAPDALAALCRKHGYDLHGEVYDAFVLRRRPRSLVRLFEPVMAIGDRINDFLRAHPSWLGGRPRALWNRMYSEADPPYVYQHLVAEQHLPLNLLGLGSGARGRVYGSLLYEMTDPQDDPSAQGPHESMVTPTDMAFEARAYLLYALRDANTLPATRFRQLFGQDFASLFPHTLHAWRHLHLAEVSTQGALTLHASTRQERGRTLMWLLDDEALEARLARHRRINLHRDTLTDLLRPLQEGHTIADGVVLTRVEAQSVVLSPREGRPLRVRVTPRLDRQTGLDFVTDPVDARLGAPEIDRAIGRLQRLIARNGSEDVGVKVPQNQPATGFIHAGQNQPAPVDRDRRQRVQARIAPPPPVYDPAGDSPRPLDSGAASAFMERGFVEPTLILQPTEVERFREWLDEIEAVQNAEHKGRWLQRDVHPDASIDHSLRPWADELVRHPRLLDAARSLLGNTLLVSHVDLYVREPSSPPDSWHRLLPSTDPRTDHQVTAWLALTRTDPHQGTLELLVGSHRAPLGDEPSISSLLKTHPITTPTLSPGEALFHHPRLVHRTRPPRVRGRQVAVAVRFLTPDVPPEVADCQAAMVVSGDAAASTYPIRDHAHIRWHS